MAEFSPHRRDTIRGPPLRILSLDGGGVRGYSMLILLQELMHRTFVEINGEAPRDHESLKPCEVFDLIVGTGTGGLISIMLGRLRMDLETCQKVYVRMTRKVFQTDKTIAGIPYKSTLFKASKLEEAIRECVREHTVFDDEGNDILANAQDLTSPVSIAEPTDPGFRPISSQPMRSLSTATRRSISPPTTTWAPTPTGRWGNAEALLYDSREYRTKTAVTAVFKSSTAGTPAAMLRSYDSRKQPPLERPKIWQAGRATSATALAFKEVRIGQSIFLDEGGGKFNPAPQALDEATINEWPGREVGVFVSVGTGKRPPNTDSQQSQWWESFLAGSIGDFAEARRKLVAKIEGCEETHQMMLREYLAKRGVSRNNYYRFNVEVGVGEFGMNEWARLSEISTNTRMYLAKSEVQQMNQSAAAKLARIHFATGRRTHHINDTRVSWDNSVPDQHIFSSYPTAMELPADEGYSGSRPVSDYNEHSPQPQPNHLVTRPEDKFVVHAPEPWRRSEHSDRPMQPDSAGVDMHRKYKRLVQTSESGGWVGSADEQAPPIPPKTPLVSSDGPPPARQSQRRQDARMPNTDGQPPPLVNMARKPGYDLR